MVLKYLLFQFQAGFCLFFLLFNRLQLFFQLEQLLFLLFYLCSEVIRVIEQAEVLVLVLDVILHNTLYNLLVQFIVISLIELGRLGIDIRIQNLDEGLLVILLGVLVRLQLVCVIQLFLGFLLPYRLLMFRCLLSLLLKLLLMIVSSFKVPLHRSLQLSHVLLELLLLL